MGKSRPISSNRVADTLMRVDLFGEMPSFKIRGKNSYQSMCGTIISVVIFASIAAYGANKFSIMVKYEDTNYQSTIKSNSIDID